MTFVAPLYTQLAKHRMTKLTNGGSGLKRFVQAVLVIIVSMAMVFLVVTPANAYSLEGPRWPGQPGAGTCCVSLTYRNLAGDSIVYNAGTAAGTAWTDSAALAVFSTSSTSNIDYGEANDSSVSWDGITLWNTHTSGGTTYFNDGMIVQLNYYYVQSYTPAKAQSVSAHEFGHALGLGHNSSCVLMNPNTPSRYSSWCGYINTPQSDDVNGVNAQY